MIVDKPDRGTNKPTWLSILRPRLDAPLCIIVLYAIALLLLVGVKPLWLDEVIQLAGTSGTGWHGLLQHVTENAGGAPLGYLGQQWLVSIAGSSVRTARLPSVFAGVGSLAVLLLICKKLALRRATVALAASLWIVCPLAFRYSLEGRPYMQAMFFAMLAVLAQIELRATCRTVWAFALAGCLAAAVYSQPFAVFAPLGFALCSTWQSRDPKYAKLTYAAYAAAGLSFLPWLLAAHAHWVDAIARRQGHFELTSSLFLVLLRECVGDGYFAAVPTILLAAYGTREFARQPRRDSRVQFVTAIISSVVFALFADARLNYFFAIRQVIYMLPFLLLIVAEGGTMLWDRHRGAAALLVIVLIASSVTKDYRHITDRNEDWDRLSGVMTRVVEAGCILLPAGDDAAKYTVLRPDIAHHLCDANLSARVIMPVHSYTDPRASGLAVEALSARGLTQLSTEEVGFAKVEVFARR